MINYCKNFFVPHIIINIQRLTLPYKYNPLLKYLLENIYFHIFYIPQIHN